MAKTENARERELDAAALDWKNAQSENNEDAAQVFRNRIWLLAFDLYDQEQAADPNAILDALAETLEKYNPEKGPFSHYFSHLFKGRKIDAYRYRERHAPDSDSLDRPISDDGKLTLGSTLLADPESEPEGSLYIDTLFAELTAQVLNFSERHTGRENNDSRRMWYQLFYTEDMTLVMKEHVFRFLHERDIFSAMDTDYLDYYMSKVCRDGQAVMTTPLKRRCDVVPDWTETDELPLPIQAKVPLAYLRSQKGISVGPSARSEQLKSYKKEKDALYRPKSAEEP